MRFQSPDVDVAEGGAFALEDADTAARKRDPADLRPVEVDLVDLAVAELDIGKLRPAQVEVGDTAIGESHLLPHAVIDNAGTDPCSGDLGVQQVSTGHVPGVGTAVRDLGTGDPGSGEVDRCVGIAEVDVRPSAVEERRLGGVCLGEVEVDELHAFEEVLLTDIAEESLNQIAEAELRWAWGFDYHRVTLVASDDAARNIKFAAATCRFHSTHFRAE